MIFVRTARATYLSPEKPVRGRTLFERIVSYEPLSPIGRSKAQGERLYLGGFRILTSYLSAALQNVAYRLPERGLELRPMRAYHIRIEAFP